MESKGPPCSPYRMPRTAIASNPSEGCHTDCTILTPRTEDGALSPASSFVLCLTPTSADSVQFTADYFSLPAVAETTLMANIAEAPAQMSSKVTDWVQQQACEKGTADMPKAELKAEQSVEPPLLLNGKPRRYKIEELLRVRFTLNMASIKLQINPEVLQDEMVKTSAEPIFRRSPLAFIHRGMRRTRGLSDVSLNSLHSIPSEEEVVYHKSRPLRQPIAPPHVSSEAAQQGFVNRFPRRQPVSPPSNSLAQQNAGFARFLKEHASPPHQRVTAGGRIVPAGGPPPVFNVDSLRASTSAAIGPPSAAGPLSTVAIQPAGQLTSQDTAAPSITMEPPISENATPATPVPSQRQSATSLAESVRQLTKQDDGKQPQHPRLPQMASSASTPIMLPDGSAVVMQNGAPYRLYWNGFQNVAEPVVIQPTAVIGPNMSTLQHQGEQTQYSVANPYAVTPSIPMMISNPSSVQNMQFMQADQQVPDHVLQRQQENLRYELKKLDKHIALRSHMFSSLEHASYVAQRKHLVEQMDNIRVTRGSRERSSSEKANQFASHASLGVPIYNQNQSYRGAMETTFGANNMGLTDSSLSNNSHIFSRGPPWEALINGTPQPPVTTYAGTEGQQKTPSAKESGTSKALSPQAPPFIPSGVQENNARKIENCLPHSRHDNISAPIPTPVAANSLSYRKPMGDLASQGTTTVSATDRDQQGQQTPSKLNSHRQMTISGSWSAMDDVIPVVHQSDVAYVDDLGLNPVSEPKLYCSMITEFQEVIRRVREQARLYGCEGGQSKDPEFDAEQDIRWAMADSSPVPLPKKMPDHIANPRPWNWTDSAFNVRADRSHPKFNKKATTSGGLPGVKEVSLENLVDTKACSANMNRNIHGSSAIVDSFRVQEHGGGFEGSRPVLGELSVNNQPDVSKVNRANITDSNVGLTSSPTNTIHEDGPAPKDDGPRSSPANVSELSGHPRRAYGEDDTDIINASTVPMVVVTEGTMQVHKVVKESVASRHLAKDDQKSPWNMTRTDLESTDANKPIPVLRYPSPPSPSWDLAPLPPEIFSKVPYKVEEPQRLLSKDTRVRFPENVHEIHSSKTNLLKLGRMKGGSPKKPLGYNEYKPISIPSGSTMSSGTPSFLRDMLKDPRFSMNNVNPQHSLPTPRGEVPHTAPRRPSSDKENYHNSILAANKAGHVSNHADGHRIFSRNATFSNPDARIGKAQSSVASSPQYAQGFVPQYPQSNQLSWDYYVRSHTPRPYNGTYSGYPGLSRPVYRSQRPSHYQPQFDGPADSPPRDTKAHSGHKANGNLSSVNGIQKEDSKVDIKVFQTDRGDLPAGTTLPSITFSRTYAKPNIETLREPSREG